MVKFFISAFAILALIGVSLFFFMPRCKQPSPMVVAITQLQCARSLDVDAFRVAACKALHGAEECEFTQEDAPQVENMFRKVINTCALKALQDNNMCVDKYEGI